MKYKEGFSSELVNVLIDDAKSKRVLDPFSGIGTTPLVAAGRGLQGTGIEIMPVGVLANMAIAYVSKWTTTNIFREGRAVFTGTGAILSQARSETRISPCANY